MSTTFMYVVWSIIAASAVVCTAFLISALIGLRPLLLRFEKVVLKLEARGPQMERAVDDLQAQLEEWRSVSESARRIASDAESLASNLRSAAEPIVSEVSDIAHTARRARAGAMAVVAGLSAFWSHRHSATNESEATVDHVEES